MRDRGEEVREPGHWRTHDCDEVDLVGETLDGTSGGEIRAGSEVDTKASAVWCFGAEATG